MFKSISPPFSDRFRWLENKASTYLCLEKGLYFYPSDKLFRGVENFSVCLPIAEPSTHPKMRIRAVRFIFRWVRKSKIDPSKCLSSGCLGSVWRFLLYFVDGDIVLSIFWVRIGCITSPWNTEKSRKKVNAEFRPVLRNLWKDLSMIQRAVLRV